MPHLRRVSSFPEDIQNVQIPDIKLLHSFHPVFRSVKEVKDELWIPLSKDPSELHRLVCIRFLKWEETLLERASTVSWESKKAKISWNLFLKLNQQRTNIFVFPTKGFHIQFEFQKFCAKCHNSIGKKTRSPNHGLFVQKRQPNCSGQSFWFSALAPLITILNQLVDLQVLTARQQSWEHPSHFSLCPSGSHFPAMSVGGLSVLCTTSVKPWVRLVLEGTAAHLDYSGFPLWTPDQNPGSALGFQVLLPPDLNPEWPGIFLWNFSPASSVSILLVV